MSLELELSCGRRIGVLARRGPWCRWTDVLGSSRTGGEESLQPAICGCTRSNVRPSADKVARCRWIALNKTTFTANGSEMKKLLEAKAVVSAVQKSHCTVALTLKTSSKMKQFHVAFPYPIDAAKAHLRFLANRIGSKSPSLH